MDPVEPSNARCFILNLRILRVMPWHYMIKIFITKTRKLENTKNILAFFSCFRFFVLS